MYYVPSSVPTDAPINTLEAYFFDDLCTYYMMFSCDNNCIIIHIYPTSRGFGPPEQASA